MIELYLAKGSSATSQETFDGITHLSFYTSLLLAINVLARKKHILMTPLSAFLALL
jgi:hypothetical protein